MDATKPYKFICFGAMDVTKPYKFIRFGTKRGGHFIVLSHMCFYGRPDPGNPQDRAPGPPSVVAVSNSVSLYLETKI